MTAFSPATRNFEGPIIRVRMATVGETKVSYRVDKRCHKLLLKEIGVSIAVISSLCEVLPCPLSSFLLDFSENSLSGITQPCLSRVFSEIRWSMFPVL
jgi:hypothetical protein